MPRFFRIFALVGLLLMIGGAAGVAAQEDDPAVGDAVDVVDAQGDVIGTVSLVEVIDPFEETDDAAPRGNRFVVAVVEVAYEGEDSLEFDPTGFLLQDTAGFVYFPEEIDLADADDPPLEAATLESGDDIAGALAFAVPDDVELVRFFALPGEEQLILVADLRLEAEARRPDPPSDAPRDQDQPTEEDLLERVTFFEDLSQDHTDGPVAYEQTPPVGGAHNPVWQNCGFYDEPIANEHAVHSLEHGAVWVTYDPDLAAADVAVLEDLTADHDFLLVSPFEGLPAPVVASAWGVQLELDGVDDPYLQAFIDFFEQGPQNPEPGAPCSGGTSSPSL